jgi:DNA invertase Pin-like site-specific DNA recombinase
MSLSTSNGEQIMKKLIGYVRVSTDEQGTAGNGLEAQRASIVKYAEDNGFELLEILQEVASGKLGLEDRPVLGAAVKKCIKAKAILVVSKLDRLSREVAFISSLMKTRVKFIVTQFPDADEFMLHMYAVLGEKERKMIGQRTKDALVLVKAKGIVLGNRTNLPVAQAAGAASNASKADDFAERMRPTLSRMVNAQMSYSEIAREFNENGTKTARGGAWHPATVSNMIARLVL